MDQYEFKFTALSRYDPTTVKSQEKRVERFLNGLRPSLKFNLTSLELTTYDEAVRKAQLLERAYELHRSGK